MIFVTPVQSSFSTVVLGSLSINENAVLNGKPARRSSIIIKTNVTSDFSNVGNEGQLINRHFEFVGILLDKVWPTFDRMIICDQCSGYTNSRINLHTYVCVQKESCDDIGSLDKIQVKQRLRLIAL